MSDELPDCYELATIEHYSGCCLVYDILPNTGDFMYTTLLPTVTGVVAAGTNVGSYHSPDISLLSLSSDGKENWQLNWQHFYDEFM